MFQSQKQVIVQGYLIWYKTIPSIRQKAQNFKSKALICLLKNINILNEKIILFHPSR